jgi:tetratricopeptide (TPR) repeat protein
MENTLEQARKVTAEVGEFLNGGTGWGALENLRRTADGENSLSDYFEFPEFTMTEAQREWQLLLNENKVIYRGPDFVPNGYTVEPQWLAKLEKALENKDNRNWYSLMHLGVMKYANGDTEGATKAFEESLAMENNAWSNRNLAMIWRNELGDKAKAVKYMDAAISINNTCRSIVLDTATTYIAAGEFQKWVDTFETLPGDMKEDGRIKLYFASALMKLDRFEDATKILNNKFEMPDMKEADTDLSDLWITLYSNILSKETGITDEKELAKMVEEKYPLGKLDFRTH